jgi:REP element-mobilizing transposase RayT
MSDDKFMGYFRIPSARAAWHDYDGGSYFVTVCTKKHVHYFGEVVRVSDCSEMTTNKDESVMRLSPVGQFLTDQIIYITEHCSYAEIPLFVVMPNHFHAIVFIDHEKTPYPRRDMSKFVESRQCDTATAPTLQGLPSQISMKEISYLQGWLSVALGGLKSAVTKFAGENAIDFAWQKRFDDRIIRDDNEMSRIANYIENNVARWDTDCFNSKNKQNQ